MRRILLVTFALAGLMAAPKAHAANPSVGECLAATENAVALKRDHKLRKAREQLLICGASSCPAMVRADCTHGVDEVNALLPTIVFTAKTGAGQELSDVRVTMDGEVVAERLDGSPLTLDPGSHEFTFVAAGQPPVTQTLILHASETGRRETIVVGPHAPESLPDAPTRSPALPPAAAVPATTVTLPVAPTATADPASTGSGQRVAGWVVGAVGLAAGVAGIAVALEGQSQHNDAVSTALAGNTSAAQGQESSANTTKTAGFVTIGAGGAFIVTGVILLLTAPSSHSKSATTSAMTFQPLLTRTGGGGAFSMEW